MKTIVDFLFETSTAKRIPLSGWPIVGAPNESLAGHMWHVAVIGYVLAKLVNADAQKVVMMCLFHDNAEIRTGDLNVIHRKYLQKNELPVLEDQLKNLEFSSDILSYYKEYRAQQTLESKLTLDSDRIALLIRIKELIEQGYSNLNEWWDGNKIRVKTPIGKKLVKELETSNSQDWWKSIRSETLKKWKKK